jgi:hypothetical protein
VTEWSPLLDHPVRVLDVSGVDGQVAVVDAREVVEDAHVEDLVVVAEQG